MSRIDILDINTLVQYVFADVSLGHSHLWISFVSLPSFGGLRTLFWTLFRNLCMCLLYGYRSHGDIFLGSRCFCDIQSRISMKLHYFITLKGNRHRHVLYCLSVKVLTS